MNEMGVGRRGLAAAGRLRHGIPETEVRHVEMDLRSLSPSVLMLVVSGVYVGADFDRRETPTRWVRYNRMLISV